MKIVGRVCVSINKAGSERFLNLIRGSGIRIDNVVEMEDKIIFWINANDFFLLKRVYKKTGIRPRIIEKKGLVFTIKKILLNKSVLTGIFLFLMMIYIATRYIWNIKLEDNYVFSKEEIVNLLNDNDIKVGQLSKSIDCSEIENILRINYNEISWVSAKIEGCTLIIQIKENVIKGDKECEEKRLDGSLVAPCEGEIEYIMTAKGTPMVKKGDVVKKGQVLIDGKIEIVDDYGEHLSYNRDLAKGEVYIAGEYYYESKMDTRYKSKIYGDSKRIIYIRVGDKKLILYKPFNISSNCDIIGSECQFKLNNDILNKIYLGNIRYLEYSTNDVEYTDTQAKDLLVSELNQNINQLREQEIFVNDYSLDFSKEGHEMKLAGYLRVLVKAKDYVDIVYDNNEKGAEINVGN